MGNKSDESQRSRVSTPDTNSLAEVSGDFVERGRVSTPDSNSLDEGDFVERGRVSTPGTNSLAEVSGDFVHLQLPTSAKTSIPAEQRIFVFITVQDQNPCLLKPKHKLKLQWNIKNGEPAITVRTMLEAAFAKQSLRNRLGLEEKDPAQSIKRLFDQPMVMLNNGPDLTIESMKRGGEKEDDGKVHEDANFLDLDEPVVNGGKYSVVLLHKQIDTNKSAIANGEDQHNLTVYEWYKMNRMDAARNLDLCFLADVNGSMQKHIDSLRTSIRSIVDKLISKNGKEESIVKNIRLAFVGYRDIGATNQFEVLPFTNSVEDFQKFCDGIKANGNGDAAKDVFGGLEKLLALDWSKDGSTRMLFHIADAPCHGREFHDLQETADWKVTRKQSAKKPKSTCDDFFPNGDPKGRSIYTLLSQLADKQIQYKFDRSNGIANKMIEKFSVLRAERIDPDLSLGIDSCSSIIGYQRFTGSQQKENTGQKASPLNAHTHTSPNAATQNQCAALKCCMTVAHTLNDADEANAKTTIIMVEADQRKLITKFLTKLATKAVNEHVAEADVSRLDVRHTAKPLLIIAEVARDELAKTTRLRIPPINQNFFPQKPKEEPRKSKNGKTKRQKPCRIEIDWAPASCQQNFHGVTFSKKDKKVRLIKILISKHLYVMPTAEEAKPKQQPRSKPPSTATSTISTSDLNTSKTSTSSAASTSASTTAMPTSAASASNSSPATPSPAANPNPPPPQPRTKLFHAGHMGAIQIISCVMHELAHAFQLVLKPKEGHKHLRKCKRRGICCAISGHGRLWRKIVRRFIRRTGIEILTFVSGLDTENTLAPPIYKTLFKIADSAIGEQHHIYTNSTSRTERPPKPKLTEQEISDILSAL